MINYSNQACCNHNLIVCSSALLSLPTPVSTYYTHYNNLCRFFRDVHGTIIMFDVSDKQTFINALSDRGSNRGKEKCWIKEVDFKAEDNNLPVKILGK